jgi:hypothetical protein
VSSELATGDGQLGVGVEDISSPLIDISYVSAD